MTGRTCIVIGAGIAGLATATRLRRSGWDVLIVERAPALRGGGYVIGFSGLGYDAAERLGLIPALREVSRPPTDLIYLDRDGRTRATMSAAASSALLGERDIALLRGDLEGALHRSLDGEVEIRFGTCAEMITQDATGVTVGLSDGGTERADLVVAADGLHSRTRELLFGPEERFRLDFPYGVATFLMDGLPAGVAPDTTPSMNLVGRTVAVYPMADGRASAFFAYRGRRLDEDVKAGAGATLRREFGDLEWAVPELLSRLDDAGGVFFDQISQARVDTWSLGRVVLLGDAAWCVSLFAGYGSSLAVAGADLLGDELDRRPDDTNAALEAWQRHLRPIVLRKQRQGRRAQGLFVAGSEPALRLRLLATRAMSAPLAISTMRLFLGRADQK